MPPSAPPVRRPEPPLDFVVAAPVLLAAVAAQPLGLARLAGASLTGAADGRSPLGALVVRLAACLPIGDLATRCNFVSSVLAAVSALLLGRLAFEALADGARSSTDRRGHLVAAVGGALTPLMCLGAFITLTSSPDDAASLALLAALWLRALRLARAPGRTRVGLGLALLAGLLLAADPVAALAGWPVAMVTWVRAFRRGERWPLLAPLLAIAGAAIALSAAVASATPIGLGALIDGRMLTAIAHVRDGYGRGLALTTGREALAQLGVVGALVAAVGVIALIARAPAFALAAIVAAVPALLAVAARLAPGDAGASWLAAGGGGAAWVILLATLTVPLAAGFAHIAGKLGAARTATAAVLAVTALVWPTLDAGTRRWSGRRDLVPEALLGQLHAELPLRARALPGTAPLRALLEYGETLGLRPDLQVDTRVGPDAIPLRISAR